MPKKSSTPMALISLLVCSVRLSASPVEPKTYAVATYECIGIYHQTEARGPGRVQYRQKGTEMWHRGLDLAFDPRDGQYRGSLVL